ncbi:MAG: hypothetical protein PHC61_14275 [Chitinivibrionales bacterium]|nr:hypothetical protein [Chitinivibrionales bacterium]
MKQENDRPNYHIIFRTCDKVATIHKSPRPFGLDKKTLIKLCFASVYESVKNAPHALHILGDDLSEEMLGFFKGYPVTIINKKMGNDASLLESFKLAHTFPDNAWVYFCEDDYLHSGPQTFAGVDDLIVNRSAIMRLRRSKRVRRLLGERVASMPLLIHPTDYPDRYGPGKVKPSLIFLSNYCHWRQISNVTFTFLCSVSTFKKYFPILAKSAHGANDGYLSRALFGNFPGRARCICVSPIPGIATHLHEGAMSPFTDWKSIVENQKSLLFMKKN